MKQNSNYKNWRGIGSKSHNEMTQIALKSIESFPPVIGMSIAISTILERVSGLSLNELLVQKILKPLGLSADSMKFMTEPISSEDRTFSRRYAFLNTDTEIEEAIKNKTLLESVSADFARKMKPSHLTKMCRKIRFLKFVQGNKECVRPVIDVLDLDGQGFDNIPGSAGLMAVPSAFICLRAVPFSVRMRRNFLIPAL